MNLWDILIYCALTLKKTTREKKRKKIVPRQISSSGK